MQYYNPEQALLETRREFGEHGGVAPSISRSSTFTVMDPSIMPKIFEGIRGPDKGGCFLYSRHFNPTVDVLARYLAAMEATAHPGKNRAAVTPRNLLLDELGLDLDGDLVGGLVRGT